MRVREWIPRRWTGLWLAAGIAAAAVAGCASHPLSGKAAPEFQARSLDGGEVALAKHLGNDVVVLDFWATWCPPCRESLPVVARIAGEYKDKGVAVYAVNIAEDPELIKSFLEDAGLDLPVLLDPDGALSDQYSVRSIPQLFVIDRKGVVREAHSGYSRGMEASLRRAIDALLKKSA